jgi:hypothetical protein
MVRHVLMAAALMASRCAAGEPDVAGPVEFHETQLERWTASGEAGARRRHAATEFAGTAPAAARRQADYEDPRTILEFVLAAAAPARVVYPTERYFYYRFDLGYRRVGGNLRFTDIERGQIHIGYFDRGNDSGWKSRTWRDGEDGVTVRFDPARGEALVGVGGTTCAFVIDREVVAASPALPLAPEEEFITAVLDESGYALDLIFNRPESRFYFLLRTTPHREETMFAINIGQEFPLVIGAESRFVFYEDRTMGRRVLVGVSSDEIRRNSYFDGPFDQVPPNLDLREKLEAAYPYVKLRGGIDEHGNFRELEGQRVAISPYQQYDTVENLVKKLAVLYRPSRTGTARWASMAYDSKEDFMREQPKGSLQAGRHQTEISLAWPANHWGEQSRIWPASHEKLASRVSAPNVEEPAVPAGREAGK